MHLYEVWPDERGAHTVELLAVIALLGLAGITAAKQLQSATTGVSRSVGAHVAALDAWSTPAPAASAPPPADAPTPSARPTPVPRPGPPPPAPAPPAAPVPPALTDASSPPIVWLPVGTEQGGSWLMKDTAAIGFMEAKRENRVAALLRAGQDHDTKFYNAREARDQVWELTPAIQDAAVRYGLDPALLSGVLGAEIDFDTDTKDIGQNIATRFGIERGQGPGAANVHLGDLEQAIAYLEANQLPGAADAAKFDPSFRNVYDHPAEAAAIVVAWKADLKRKAGGTVSTPEDMAIIFGAYRTGEGNFDLKNNRIVTGAEELVRETGDPNAAMGSNAYQAEPYFDYYIEYYKGLQTALHPGGEAI